MTKNGNIITHGFNISAIEECILIDSSKKIYDKEFSVFIPRLFPKLSAESSPKEKSTTIPADMCVNPKFKFNSSIKEANHIKAKSATYFRTQYKGDVKEMQMSDGATELSTTLLTHNDGVDAPHPPHDHKIIKPIKFTEMIYSKLDEKEIKNGAKMFGVFVGGDLNNFRITYIEDQVPREA